VHNAPDQQPQMHLPMSDPASEPIEQRQENVLTRSRSTPDPPGATFLPSRMESAHRFGFQRHTQSNPQTRLELLLQASWPLGQNPSFRSKSLLQIPRAKPTPSKSLVSACVSTSNTCNSKPVWTLICHRNCDWHVARRCPTSSSEK
jgi:hypothetical protein